MSEDRTVVVGETADGDEISLPVVELLTGRGFVTGKSGSGKSNTASVIAEELLESGFPLLIVDTDGEYYGLKEEYEMLHAGADEECDIQIGPEHAEQMATLALEENVPIILDVSGYLDEEVADELLRRTAKQLFVKEKKLKKPFLLVVEEVHEYIPEGGGVDETGKLLIKIGKRGRKHGLGILGISQRPADVKKDFITQANWLVWHRLTWDNDTKVVGRIIDTEYTERVSDLGDGEAFVQTDWTDADVRRIQFRRKRTFDAGATPGLDDFERPELQSVSDALVGELQDISEQKRTEESRIESLEERLEKREKRIDTLEDDLAAARDVSNAAEQLAEALSTQGTVQTQLPEMGEEFRRLHEELVEIERERDALRQRLEKREEQLVDRRDQLTEYEERLEEREERIETLEDRLSDRRRRIDALESSLASAQSQLKARTVEGTDESKPAVDAGGTADSDEDDEPTESDEGDGKSDEILHADGDDLEFGYTSVDDPSEILVADGKRASILTTTAEPEVSEPTPSAGEDGTPNTFEAENTPEAENTLEAENTPEADESAVNDTADGQSGDGASDGIEPAETDTDATAFEFGPSLEDGRAGGTLDLSGIDEQLSAAADGSRCDVETAREVVAALSRAGPATSSDLAAAVDRSPIAVQSLLSELRIHDVLGRSGDGSYELGTDVVSTIEARTEE